MKRLTTKFTAVILTASVLLMGGCVYADLETDLHTQNIYPNIDSTYVIGDTDNEYSEGHFDDLYVTHDLDVDHMMSCPSYIGGNIQVTGKMQADRLIGDIEGYTIDVVQSSDLNIALNDTLDLTFTFVPDVIVLYYSGRCQHDTTLEEGHTIGHCYIEVTAVDTMTCNTNYTALVDDNGAFGSHIGQNDNVNSVVVYGGNDGVDDGNILGVGSWTTATKVLRLTFSTVANTNAATNYVEIMAIAYR